MRLQSPPSVLFLQLPVLHNTRHLQLAIFSLAYHPHHLTPEINEDILQTERKYCLFQCSKLNMSSFQFRFICIKLLRKGIVTATSQKCTKDMRCYRIFCYAAQLTHSTDAQVFTGIIISRHLTITNNIKMLSVMLLLFE